MMKKELKKRITLLITALLIVSQICMNTNVVFAEEQSEVKVVSDDGDSVLEDGSSGNTGDNKGDNPDGDNPDGDNPDGDNPDGDNPDGDNPDGDNPDGDNPDGDNPDGDNPDGDNPDGDNPDGDNPDGDNPDGDNPDGDNPDGDNPDGDNPDGDNPDGDNPDGDNPDGDNPDGDNPDGDNPDGDNPDGDNPDGDNPDEDSIKNIDDESSVSENSVEPQKAKKKVQEKAINNPVIEEIPISYIYPYDYETMDTMNGVSLIKGTIPENSGKASETNKYSVTMKVGESGKKMTCSRSWSSCNYCKKQLTDKIWNTYYLVEENGGYEISNPDIIKDCYLALSEHPSTPKPGIAFNYTAAKPGITTVKLTFYTTTNYRVTGAYCDDCDRKAKPSVFGWREAKKEYVITVTGDYALIYDANGGENAPDAQRELDTTESSWTFTVSDKEPTREGYIFKGWSTSQEGTSDLYHASDEITLNETGEVTVYAVWEPDIKYTVTYTDGVDDEEVFVNQVYTCKPNVDTPEFDGTPYREGYDFIGWRPEVAKTVTGDATYIAQWKKKPVATTYTVRWYDSDSKEIKTAQTRSANVDDVVHVTDTDKVVEGYIFDSNNAKNVLEATALEGGATTLKLYFYVDKPHKPNKPKPDKPDNSDKPSEPEQAVTTEKVEKTTTVVTTTQTVVDKEVQPQKGSAPRTGEEDFTILYACLAALAGCGLVILRLRRGKRNKDNDNE